MDLTDLRAANDVLTGGTVGEVGFDFDPQRWRAILAENKIQPDLSAAGARVAIANRIGAAVLYATARFGVTTEVPCAGGAGTSFGCRSRHRWLWTLFAQCS